MSTYLASKAFWIGAGERAVKTVAQAGIALLTAAGTDLLHVNWTQGAAVALGAGVLSVLTSLATGDKASVPVKRPAE